jgi:hypothetical protein
MAPILLVLAGAVSACKEPLGVLDAAPIVAESAVRASGGSRAAVGAFSVDAMTIETRYWNSSQWVAYADGNTTWLGTPPSGLAAVAAFEALPRATPGYTNAPIELPSLQCAVFIPGVTGTPPDYSDGQLPQYYECIRNPGDGTLASHANLAVRYRARISSTKGTNFAVRFGVDLAGGVLLVDGQVRDQKWNDPFWGGFFESDFGDGDPYVPLITTDTSVVLTASFRMSANSTHIIEVIGFENGGDFGASAQFNDGGGWIDAVSMVPSYKVPLSVSTGTGGGTVTSTPAGISCGASCSASFAWATMPTLTAVPASYFAFSSWSGACSGSGWCAPLVESPKSVTATFTRVQWPLRVTLAGVGSGTVTSADNVINCGAACESGFPINATVTLTAASGANSAFAGWSGGGCSGTGSCVVPMNQAQYVTATFNLERFALNVATTGTGSGTVTSSPAGISCETVCSPMFDFGTVVTLTASATTGSTFDGWTGAGCAGTGTCTVTMNQAQSVTATFTRSATGDTDPPVISCQATPNVLWPVNHKLVDITVQVSLTDASVASFTLVSVLSNEPTNELGDGSTSADISDWLPGTADVAGKLRAERSGSRKDRIYTLTYRGTDASGNSADATCTVTVPHDKR